MVIQFLIYLISFIIIWFGSGLVVSSADKFSRKLKLSSFSVSFFILGMLTSTPEFAVGLTSLAEKNPEIYIGNLIGGVAVIFLLIIPLLAILGNGIKLHSELNNKNLIFTLIVIICPALFILDKNISMLEGILLILMYFVLFYLIEKEKGFFSRQEKELLQSKSYAYLDILKVIFGIGLIFISSQIIVDKTLYFSHLFGISPFFISLVILSLGTNLPELSLAVRSVILGKKDIAFGDYLGSASANTFLFGLFTILNTSKVLTANNFLVTFILLLIGLILFYIFSKTKNKLSRKEGFILLSLYLIFILIENVR